MKEKQKLLSSILILVIALFAFVVVAMAADEVNETPTPLQTNQTISPEAAVSATFVILLAFALLIFIGVLADRKLNRGEMRRAIAGTFVVGFTMLMILSLTYDCSYRREIGMMYIELVSIIIGFYFGSRAVAEKKESEKMEEEKTPEQISIENVQFTEKSDTIFNITIRNSGAFEATVDRVYIDNEPKQIEKETISPKSTKDLSIKHEWEKGKNYKIKVATTEGTIIEKEEKVPIEKEETVSLGESVVRGIETMRKGAEAVEGTAEAVEGTVRAGKAITDVVIGKVETTGETKESSGKMVKNEHKKEDEASQQE